GAVFAAAVARGTPVGDALTQAGVAAGVAAFFAQATFGKNVDVVLLLDDVARVLGDDARRKNAVKATAAYPLLLAVSASLVGAVAWLVMRPAMQSLRELSPQAAHVSWAPLLAIVVGV